MNSRPVIRPVRIALLVMALFTATMTALATQTGLAFDTPTPRFSSLEQAVDAGVVPRELVSEVRQGKDTVAITHIDDNRKVIALEAVARHSNPVRAYEHLPIVTATLNSEQSLLALANSPEVRRISPNRRYRNQLDDSLAWLGQPEAKTFGATGAGTYVAVIDSGVDLARPAFGSCTAPSLPPTCRVALLPPDFTTKFSKPYSDGQNDDACTSFHGTHVAGVVAGSAPATMLIVADVFQPASTDCKDQIAWGSDILAAVDYIIGLKQSGLNIVAVNMSFSDGARSTTDSCFDDMGIGALRSAGITPVAAAGNAALANGVYQGDGISSPACIAGTLAVGALHTGGGEAAFSQSAPISSLLFAPGIAISSAGLVKSGTSMAAPFVAASIAMTAQMRPDWTLDQRLRFLLDSSAPIPARYQPRLDQRLDLSSWPQMLVRPANDDRASAKPTTSATSFVNAYSATVEAGEPSHGGVEPIRTIWYRHVMSRTGRLNIESRNAVGVYFPNDPTILVPSIVSKCLGNTLSNCVRVAAQQGDVIEVALSGASEDDWLFFSKFSESGEMYFQRFVSAPKPQTLTLKVSGPTTPIVHVVDLGADSAGDPYTAPVIARNAHNDTVIGPFVGNNLGVLVGDTPGSATLLLSAGSATTNDFADDGAELVGASGEARHSNALATPTTGSAFDRDLWYRWLSPGTGRFMVSTYGSNFDTDLCVRSPLDEQCAVGKPSESGGPIGSGVSAFVHVGVGDVVTVRVGSSVQGVAQGTVRLRWRYISEERHPAPGNPDRGEPPTRPETPIGVVVPPRQRTPSPSAGP